MASNDQLTMIDLFAGSGGLGLGLEMAGFSPLYVNELNKHALETYLINRDHQHSLLREKYNSADIGDVVKTPDYAIDLLNGFRRDYSIRRKDVVDLVVGGPPCQGYSSVGLRRSYDVDRSSVPANHLYTDMVTFIRRVRPRAFLFENVAGLLQARWTKSGSKGEIFEDVLQTFKSIPDYSVKYKKVYSKDYGVPQNRPRVLIVGFRADVFEGTTSSEDAVEGGFLPKKRACYPHLVDVLSDLVDHDFEYGGRTTKYPRPAQSEFQRRMREDTRTHRVFDRIRLHDHEYSNHSVRIQSKFLYMIAHGGKIKPSHQTKKFRQRVLPKTWDEAIGPTITITSLPDDFVHYEQARSLTVRECARIQTFPDWYRFTGPRTTGGLRRAGNPLQELFSRELPQYTQIANAVPVDLAAAIGEHLGSILQSAL